MLTRALLESGAQVLASDVSQAGLAALEADLASAGLAEPLTVRTLDISMSGACAEAVADLHRRCGSVDILINNGAMGMQSFRADHLTNLVSIDEITPDIWNKFVAVNLSGAWYLTKAAQPHMKAKGWGRIINVTTSFFTMLRGRFHPYGPVKAGLEAMSAGHAAEFASDGVTVNVVVPGGPSDTDMVPKEAPYARQDLIQPAQMVAPILWLCSDAGGEVTGSRFVAANWDASLPIAEARAASEAPIAWPDLAGTPVWPGGKPNE